jgi:hypothetical protein
MPHVKTKSKTTKAVKRASRVLKRIKDKNEFEHLQYLESQLDKDGIPIDILNTDHELLTYEQKLIAGIVKMLSYIDLRSIVIYMYQHYDKENISEIITNYYSNKQNKTWADSFFQVTYKCLGILNLEHLVLDKVLDEMENIIETTEHTDKPVMTDEIFYNIVNQFRSNSLDVNELITTSLLVYSQNQDYCMIGGKKRRMKRVMKGGLTGIPFFDFFIMGQEAVAGVGSVVGTVGEIASGIIQIITIIGVGLLILLLSATWKEERLEREQKKRDLVLKEKKKEEERNQLLWELGAEQREADEKKRKKEKKALQKELADKAAAEQRDIDAPRFILKALEMGHAGNREELIRVGELQENKEKIEQKKQKLMQLEAEKLAKEEEQLRLNQRKWWQRLPGL